MKLLSSLCRGSGAVNEDAARWLGPRDDISAAWVFDGVTGINPKVHLPGPSDAAWLVARASQALSKILAEQLTARETVAFVVEALERAQAEALDPRTLPADYDPPAACLLLLRRIGAAFELIRLGDSQYAIRDAQGLLHTAPATPLDADSAKVTAQALRLTGAVNQKKLMERLRAPHRAMRQRRNRPGGYGILEADARCLDFLEVTEIADPQQALLCSDGYYRLADLYHVYTPETLLARSALEMDALYAELRAIEAADPLCQRYPRIKPGDDAAAICLASA